MSAFSQEIQTTTKQPITKGSSMYKKLFLGLALFSIITVLLAACAIVDTATQASGPTVHMGGAVFIQTSITVKKGDMLNLVDDSSAQHIFFFSSRRRHTRCSRDWSSDVCSSD